jgi:hypothetical protein
MAMCTNLLPLTLAKHTLMIVAPHSLDLLAILEWYLHMISCLVPIAV